MAATTVNVAAMSEVTVLGAEFRALRAQAGHFTGGPWNADVDKFNGSAGHVREVGAKHVVMNKLQEHFKDGTRTLAELTDAMGAPDEVGREPRDFPMNQANLPLDPHAAVQQAGGPVYLAYFWRGKHDLLWFKTDGQAVLEVDWWMAYE